MGPLNDPDNGFLWINKDANNVASKEHHAAVNAYVQKLRRSELLQPKKTSTKASRTYFLWNRHANVQCEGDTLRNQRLPHRPKRRNSYPPRSPTPKYAKVSSPPIRRASSDTVTSKCLDIANLKNILNNAPRRPSEPPDFLLPSFASSPLSSPLTSQLDPFFPLPCHATQREKSLIHFYFTTMPEAVYATHSKAAFCPIRDTTTIGVQADQTFLQWIVVAAQMYLLQGKPSAADEPHILSRKAYIYKLMNRAIADPNTCYSDNTLTAMAAAGIAEARIGNPGQGQKHLIALRILIEARGGSSVLQDMLFGQAMVITASYIGTGTGDATFADVNRLRTVTKEFIATFQAMQAWNQNLRVEFEESDTDEDAEDSKYSIEQLPPVSNMHHFTQIRELQRYRSSRSKVFGTQSFLRRYIAPISSSSIPSERRSHFAVLWIINKMLYDLRHDHHESREFIERLLRDIVSGEIPPTARDGVSTVVASGTVASLKPLTVVYILAASAAKHSPEFARRGGILHSWDSIDMLELMELATRDSQTEVTAMLSGWLTNDECDIFYMRDSRLHEISNEITNEWFRRRRPLGKT